MLVAKFKKIVLPLLLGVMMFATVFSPMVTYAAPVDHDSAAGTYDVVPAYDVTYTMMQTDTLDIQLDTTQLFTGAQIMIDALSSPYLLLAGFGLGVAILGAIMKAVTHIRI
jgi:hypothetical protein